MRRCLPQLALFALLGTAAAGCYQEDELLAAYAPQQAPTEPVVYATLAPYGTWMDTDIYGSIWCPSPGVVGTGFSPYGHGRWLWSTGGWYYDSYYSWGWLPYHYGNWVAFDVCPWGWVPGYAWAPAWAYWEYGHPIPIAPRYPGRPYVIGRPPGVVVTPAVSAHVVTPRLDVTTGRFVPLGAPASQNARLVSPRAVVPGAVSAPMLGRPSYGGMSGTVGRPTPGVPGAGTQGYGYHAAPGSSYAPGPAHMAAPAGGGFRGSPVGPAAPAAPPPAAAPVHSAPSGGGFRRHGW